MGNDKQHIRRLIKIICFTILPLTGTAQDVDSLIYCNDPDTEARPPFEMHELLHLVLDNHPNGIPECFDPNGTFYFNIIILADGTVTLLNLECVSNNQSCIISIDDISKWEKWIPAVQNGKNCNQKLRIRTHINFD